MTTENKHTSITGCPRASLFSLNYDFRRNCIEISSNLALKDKILYIVVPRNYLEKSRNV